MAHSIQVFLSLPFTPLKNRTHFYNGHLAMAVDETVYQVFNPRMLKCGFLVSKMPLAEWLYGRSNRWSFNEIGDERYSSVYLYGRGEALRTKVFLIERRGVSGHEAQRIRDYFSALERRYQDAEVEYHPVRLNCSTAIYDALSVIMPLKKRVLRFLPTRAFRYIMAHFEARDYPYSLRAISAMNTKAFRLHAFCLGFIFRNAERYFESKVLASGKGRTNPPFRDNVLYSFSNKSCAM